MKKDAFFIYLANNGYLKYRAILLALFGVIEKNKTIIVTEPRDIKNDTDTSLCTITEDSGLTFIFKDSSVKIDWYVPGEPLYTNKGTLTLNANDIPNVSEKVVTTYGRVLANQLLLLENDIRHIKFVNGNWINDKIIKRVMEKIAKDDSITSEQAHDFVNAIQFVSSLTQLFVPSASEKALTTDPRIAAKKKELLEKYKDKLDDPAIISKIEQELVAMDRAWLKGDISEGFYKSGKDFNVSRKRMFIMHGGEKSFIDDSKIDMIKFSLNEGWDLEELPKVANSLRDGSYGRGAATAMGGERVKKFQQAFQNSRISLTDCGSKRGGMFVITEDNKKDFIGRTNMKDELLTEDSLNKFIGKTLEIRSPLYCLGDKTDYCEVCSGIKMGESPNIVNTLTAAVGSVFMLIEMKSTHGKELLTANFSLKNCLS